jgi:hypothetical protein
MQQRQVINNSTFENEFNIGKAIVLYWNIIYNIKHVGKMSIYSFLEENIFMFI